MRRCFVLVFLLMAGCSANAVEWLTITGDKNDQNIDTTQLDISSYQRIAAGTVLRFRVNLATQRQSANGEVYHSYISHIVVECPDSIRHEDQTRYRDALWEGPFRFEKFVQPKPMAFVGLKSEPRGKILNIACSQKRP